MRKRIQSTGCLAVLLFGLSVAAWAASSNIRITGAVVTSTETSSVGPLNMTGLGTVLDTRSYTLSTSFQALTVPTGATRVLIVVPASAQTVTLKGITGDTGIAWGTDASNATWAVLPVTSPSIGLVAGGSVSGVIVKFFN